MLKQWKWPWLLLLASLLSACGGGGGGSDSESAYRLTFTPGTLSARQAQGSSLALAVTATLDRTVAQTVNIFVVDTAGVIEPTLQLVALSSTSYQATLNTKASLGIGQHRGSLQVRLCFDAVAACNSPLPGSPFLLPYDFTVSEPVIPPAATVSPAQLSVDAYQNEVPTLQLGATLAGTGLRYPQIVDPAGVFQPNPPTSISGSGMTATLFLSDSLAPGNYAGNLELRVCKDLACTLQMPGSPVLVPYAITLKASSHLTPLVRAPGWASGPSTRPTPPIPAMCP